MAKIRIHKNWNKKTDEDFLGLSIKPDGSRFYCKYPIEHQQYKSKDEATAAMIRLKRLLENGAKIAYSSDGSRGINKNEWVRIQLNELKYGVCRVCGCTDNNPCYNPKHGNCWWADEEQTICSHCAVTSINDDPLTIHCINDKHKL